MQNNFLWGGSEEKRKMHWARYADVKLRAFMVSRTKLRIGQSRCGNGHSIFFWHALWLKKVILKDIFPNIYSISQLQDVSIGAMGGWIDGRWLWGDIGIALPTIFDVVAAISSADTGAAPSAPVLAAEWAELVQLLTAAVVTVNQPNAASWKHDGDGAFSVSSCYNLLCRKFIPFGPTNCFDFAFVAILKVEVPLKVKASEWRSFLNKVPTKDALLIRGILNSSSNLECVICKDFYETLQHSFLLCCNAAIVWMEMSGWIGLSFNNILDFKESFWYWSSFCRAKKVKRGKEGVIWLAILWSIWLHRNDILFNNSSWNSRDAVWNCKTLI
ncbi:uncharacterized protein LOC131657919 [Vicia villosa]|uniref:uncharacterized protein LOC131657919 n=1 Tax=Vicia villosa TaxID=3911 RepID=UPI00273BA7F7|nr:uncharacterized protein LOC131657919 [Vicia villosa]